VLRGRRGAVLEASTASHAAATFRVNRWGRRQRTFAWEEGFHLGKRGGEPDRRRVGARNAFRSPGRGSEGGRRGRRGAAANAAAAAATVAAASASARAAADATKSPPAAASAGASG